MTAQNLARKHARQNDVVGKLCLAGALRSRINLAERLADDIQWSTVIHGKSATKRHKKHKIKIELRIELSSNHFEFRIDELSFFLCLLCLFVAMLFPTHINSRAAIPSLHRVRVPPPTQLLRNSYCSR